MNKKFTMVVAALLAMGSSAFAQTPFGDELSNNMKVYLGGGDTPTYLVAAEQSTKPSEGDRQMTFDEAADFAGATPFTVCDLSVKDTYADFSLKDKDGKYVYVTLANGGAATDEELSALTKNFRISLKNKKVTDDSRIVVLKADGSALDLATVGTPDYLIISSGSYDYGEGSGSNIIKMYVASANTGIEASELNSTPSGKFTIAFKDAEASVFSSNNLKAFQVSNGNMVAGTYFATNWPSSLDDANTLDLSSEMAKFQQCTFIAVNPSSHKAYYGLDRKQGDGFEFTTVSGRDLLPRTSGAADIKNGKLPSANAAFTVNEPNPLNAAKNYAMTVDAWYIPEAEKAAIQATDLNVAAIPNEGKLYVLTAKTVADDMTGTFTLAQSGVVSAEKFLSETTSKVYNIQFVSKTAGDKDDTNSEYGKYLGLGHSTSYTLFAQGSDFLNLDAAQNQWIVVDADLEANTVTFQNREDNTQKFTAKLVETSNTDEYQVVEDGTSVKFGYAYVKDGVKTHSANNTNSLNGTTIKLTEKTVNPTAGFVTDELDNAGLIKLGYEVETLITPKKLYLAEHATTDGTLLLNEEDAVQWELVKFDTDTIYSYNTYAYLGEKDGKKVVKTDAVDKDSIAVVSFALRQFGTKDMYLAALPTTETSLASAIVKKTDVAEAEKFVIKINADGSYAMLPAGTNTDYRQVVNSTKTVSDLSLINLNFTKTNVYADHNTKFFIETEEFGESLADKSQHVTFKDAKLGAYLAVGENGNGIVAPVSELKASYTTADLTFWLDTASNDEIVPEFYITKGSKDFMYNALDSAKYYNEGTASGAENKDYYLPSTKDARAIFRAATLKDANTLVTTIKDAEKELTAGKGLEDYKFNIVKNEDGDYLVRSVKNGTYLYNLNGELGFGAKDKAMTLVVETAEAPTSNEGVSATEVKVVANDGSVVVKNAAGKNVVVSTILGQVVANEVLTSDNATINVPAGIVVVAVEGESFKVNVK